MRRLLPISLVAILMIGTMSMTNATAKQPAGPCTGYYVTPRTDPTVRTRRVKNLIRCAFHWAGIPGQIPTALYVADRESSYYPWAYNPSGCAGLFQHQLRYWDGRVRASVRRGWFRHWIPTAFNARANALVTAKMVRAGGWSAWSTA